MIRLILPLVFLAGQAWTADLLTNCAHFTNPPKWLNLSRVNRVAEAVTRTMEWDVRRVQVQWYHTQKEFEAAHSLGPLPMAVTQRSLNRIILGPKVVESNFDRVFAHELVHVSSEQKYKGAIPKWLEEGVANYVAQYSKVDYVSMNKRPLPADVTKMTHPMSGSEQDIINHYATSQAVTEMIASRCDFKNLLRLSVQRKMEDYLEKICKISDINQSFQKWVKDQAALKKKSP
jgi:hypothetical protein